MNEHNALPTRTGLLWLSSWSVNAIEDQHGILALGVASCSAYCAHTAVRHCTAKSGMVQAIVKAVPDFRDLHLSKR
jgi:hypothetical protein